ncbi:unnamed protein product [Sphenostylis stenocarpa]|uniref:Uncharacterized protein n=1 Tax=Sphenostylis stenocarpa TaxID=92480 RepID=A0AA86SUY7_9FABA|nr:unnamed protein product [Sphenostylis stenocarpa]
MVKRGRCSPPTPPPNLFDFFFFFRSLSVSVLSSPISRDQKEEPTNATPKLLFLSLNLSTRQFHYSLTSPYSLPTLFLHSFQIGVAVHRSFLPAIECFVFSGRFFMELMVWCTSCALSRFHCKRRFAVVVFEVKLC